jgi:hypothetical protein
MVSPPPFSLCTCNPLLCRMIIAWVSRTVPWGCLSPLHSPFHYPIKLMSNGSVLPPTSGWGRPIYLLEALHGQEVVRRQSDLRCHGRGFGTNVRSARIRTVRTNDQEAQAAIAALNGSQVEGRALTVNEARPKAEGAGRRSGGFGGGGGGRRY